MRFPLYLKGPKYFKLNFETTFESEEGISNFKIRTDALLRHAEMY